MILRNRIDNSNFVGCGLGTLGRGPSIPDICFLNCRYLINAYNISRGSTFFWRDHFGAAHFGADLFGMNFTKIIFFFRFLFQYFSFIKIIFFSSFFFKNSRRFLFILSKISYHHSK